MRQVLGIFFFIFISITSLVSAGELKTDILQYRNDKLYFAGGKDVLIFKNQHFSVFNKDNQQIYSGKIEQSLEGVSFSSPTELFFDSLSIKDCYAVIETADIDTVSEIKIGFDVSNVCSGTKDSTIRLIPFHRDYPDKDVLTLDGLLSYNRIYYINLGNTKYHPAPCIAFILPNLSKKVNEQKYLSTSLYYRFDNMQLSYLFDGTDPAYESSFINNDSILERTYKYDPERGKRLARNIRNKPDSLIIGSDPYLKKAADYFADILAQDRFIVTTTDNYKNSDVYIGFAPYLKSDPVKTFEWIVNQLESVDIPDEADKEAIDIIKKHIESYKATDRPESEEYYLKLMDYSLKYDLGVFPLFRPTLYFHYFDNLTNVRFNDNGDLDYDSMRMVSFPATKDSL